MHPIMTILSRCHPNKCAFQTLVKTGLVRNNHFGFLSQQKLDEIMPKKSDNIFKKLKQYALIGQYIVKHIFTQFFKDITDLKEINSSNTISTQQSKRIWMIKQNIRKLGKIFLINILPMSAPLILLFIYTYPSSVPTWLNIDKNYEILQADNISKQIAAITYFKNRDSQQLANQWRNLSLYELRKLSELMFGFYGDGTIGIAKILKKPFNYCLTEQISKTLLIRFIKLQLKREFDNIQLFKNKNLDERVAIKITQIVHQNHRIKHIPLTKNDNEYCSVEHQQQSGSSKSKQQLKQQTQNKHQQSKSNLKPKEKP